MKNLNQVLTVVLFGSLSDSVFGVAWYETANKNKTFEYNES